MMTRSLRFLSKEVRDLATYDGLGELDGFLDRFEREVSEKQRFEALKWALCATPMRWWGMHQGSIEDWHECKRMMHMCFGKPKMRLIDKYNVQDYLCMHLSRCVQAYSKQLVRMHMDFTLGNTVNKHVLGGEIM